MPLFFAEGTYQASLGVGTLAFWLFLFGIIPLSFAFTWVYNNTNRSILAVILFHGMVNFTGELFDISERANTISMVLWVIAAIGITPPLGVKDLHPPAGAAGCCIKVNVCNGSHRRLGKEKMTTTIKSFDQHAVLIYYVLVFTISGVAFPRKSR